MSNISLQSPLDAFTKMNSIFVDVRKPDEIDLIGAVRKILDDSGLIQNRIDNFDTNRYIIDGAFLGPKGQRFLLNRFFYLQLISLDGINTMDERFCLIEDGTFEDWLRLFSNKVLPCLISNNLPRKI